MKLKNKLPNEYKTRWERFKAWSEKHDEDLMVVVCTLIVIGLIFDYVNLKTGGAAWGL